MAMGSGMVRWLAYGVVVVGGVLAASSLLGGPSAGKWQGAITGAALVAWLLVLGASGPRGGDPTERRLLWGGLACSGFLFVAGVIDALA
jgi:hypothetical protein